MGNVTCQEKKPGQAGKMFWVDQPHGASRFHGDRPMVKVLVTFVGGWSSDRRTLTDYRKALLDTVAHVDQLIQGGAQQAERRADGAEHGGAHPRSGGAPAGAELAAHPHGNHGESRG